MVLAILFAFEYKRSHYFTYLPGSVIDLYYSYVYCKKMNWDVAVITDIQDCIKNRDLIQGAAESVVPIEVFSFLEKEEKKYIIRTSDECGKILEQMERHDKVFLYYTGHGTDRGIAFPDGSVMTPHTLKHFVNFKEMFILMDCCHPFTFNLRYQLEGKLFVYNKYSINNIDNITVLFTMGNGGTSITSRQGSLFTKIFFELIQSKRTWISIKGILDNIVEQYGQKVSLLTGIPTTPVIPGWINGKMNIMVLGDILTISC